jgi:hypothetical protein
MVSSRPLQSSNTGSPASHEQAPNRIDKFERFAKLAPEIKKRVWVFATKGPRVVRWGCARPPAIFHANRQSRDVALKEHSLVMPFQGGRSYGIYISYGRDILYRKVALPKPVLLRNEWEWGFQRRIIGTVWCPSWLRSVKRLAIPLDDAFILAKTCSPDPELWTGSHSCFPSWRS